jgi:hypothetical protein
MHGDRTLTVRSLTKALRCAGGRWIVLCLIQPLFQFANVLRIELASHLTERPARLRHLQRAPGQINTDNAH